MIQNLEIFLPYIEGAKVIMENHKRKHCRTEVSGKIIFFKCDKVPEKEKVDIENFKLEIDQAIAHAWEEVEQSQEMNSPNILRYQKIIISYPYICLVHQPILCNLKEFLTENLDYKTKINLMMKIAQALKTFHDKNICLRNLNCSNIAIASYDRDELEVVFTDISEMVKLGDEMKTSRAVKEISNHTAPEIVSERFHSLETDIWSLGLIFYRILFERELNLDEFFSKRDKSESFPKETPLWLISFIEKMTLENPRQRHSIRHVIEFLKKAEICGEAMGKFFL